MALVGRFYERLGDHAVNIARRMEYARPPAAGTSSPERRPPDGTVNDGGSREE
jgi:phosphate uptake regulator